MLFYCFSFLFIYFTIRFLDRLYQRSLMKKFVRNGRVLSPISRKIIERWKDDYSKLSEIINSIDTTKLNPEDKKNLALGVNALNFFYQAIEPTIGTGVRRYKIHISNMLQHATKLIVEISKKAESAA